MKIIRQKTFETNSSSTHSLVISKNTKFSTDGSYSSWTFNIDDIDFCRQEFGFLNRWDEKLAFWLCGEYWRIQKDENLYKSIKEKVFQSAKGYVNKIDRDEKFLDSLIKDIEKFFNNFNKYHTEDHLFFMGEVNFPIELSTHFLEDNDYLMSYLFGGSYSYVALGGDEYRGHYLKTIGFENDYWEDAKDYNEFHELYKKKLSEYVKDNDVYFVGTESGTVKGYLE